MQYLLLIYEDPKEMAALTPADQAKIYPEYRAFTESIVKSGNFRNGDPLQPVTAATTIRLRKGKKVVTDGPFAETAEHLVGYYLVEAADLDQATEIAGRIPSVRWGAIEVRPVRTM